MHNQSIACFFFSTFLILKKLATSWLHYQGEQVKGFKEKAEDLGIIKVIKTVIHRFKV